MENLVGCQQLALNSMLRKEELTTTSEDSVLTNQLGDTVSTATKIYMMYFELIETAAVVMSLCTVINRVGTAS
jgi:hypothetical protein